MGEFLYIVADDSMSGDRILCGDVIRIQETKIITSGDIVAIACQDDISTLTLRRVGIQGLLHSHSATSVNTELENQEKCLIVGKVVKFNMNA